MKKILVIDDDEGTLRALGFRLEAEGHEAVLAPNGLGGFSRAVKERPDLILLDVSPDSGGEGYKVAERIQTNPVTTGTPIVLIGVPPGGTAQADGRLGAVAAFPKPVPTPELLEAVRSALLLVGGDRFRA